MQSNSRFLKIFWIYLKRQNWTITLSQYSEPMLLCLKFGSDASHFIFWDVSHTSYGDTCVVLVHLVILFPVERRTRLPCSTLEKARRTNAPFCPTRRAVRLMRTLSLGWDGRWNNTSNPLNESVVSGCHVLGLYQSIRKFPSLSGESGHSLWVYGWFAEKWQHR